MFSHTEQSTSYTESGYAPINNGATDNTNQLKADLKFNHDFGKYGKLLTFVKGSYEYNRTRYTGSAVALDRARSSRVSIAANYDVTLGNVYSHIGFGWDWDRLQFGNMTDRPRRPTLTSRCSMLSKRNIRCQPNSPTVHGCRRRASRAIKSLNHPRC